MVSLEQVKLLDQRITKTLEHIRKITDENSMLKSKLDSYQQRIGELEVLIQRFREDQTRIEDGILSALDRLNQFEDALESTLTKTTAIPAAQPVNAQKKKNVPPPVVTKPDEPQPEEDEELELYEDEADKPADNELDIF